MKLYRTQTAQHRPETTTTHHSQCVCLTLDCLKFHFYLKNRYLYAITSACYCLCYLFRLEKKKCGKYFT